ncbi:aminotransferase class III-fold pyridoxal phosphate-dependent enzyme [Nocardioides plantarum]|uniref:Aminotransferase class III-fold pyridoxal phosphate-dependent enzyme n=1 Tax=Nocardioides plantarum TaxID=29299 RepID=A0ABV5KAN3_9ACTN|nr:aminotransferase class III-fold pyridoxal phosphate-dependent enzyme [Nocardioides plantarum]
MSVVERGAVLYPDLNASYPVAVSASDSTIRDDQGRDYLDGCSGALVVNLGHGRREVLDAMHRQSEAITFTYRTQFTSAPAERLARRLTDLAPGSLDHAFFTNSGSEAIEAAIRMALQYWQERGRPGKQLMISRDGSYHGATLGAVALSGHPARRRTVEAVLPAWPRAAAASCHACPFGQQRHSCALQCAASIEQEIVKAGADRVAAVVIEPVVGASGGAVPAPTGYLRAVAEICRTHDVLLVADETITGLGRTGHWFACDEAGIEPDLMVLGKGLSAGYVPLGALLVSEEVHRCLRDGSARFTLGHTYAANPLAMAVGEAVVDYTVRHQLPERAARIGAQLTRRLRTLLAAHAHVVRDLRGAGLLIGIEFVAPDTDGGGVEVRADQLVAAALRRGLVLYPAGTGTVQRTVLVAPPLTISETDVEVLLHRFALALEDVIASQTVPS